MNNKIVDYTRIDYGRCDQLITIKVPVKLKGRAGSSIETFDTDESLFAENVAAEKIIERNVERYSGDQLIAISLVHWKFPFITGVNATMIVIDQATDEVYQAVADPVEIQRKMGWVLSTKLKNNT